MKYPMYKHQREEFENYKDSQARALFWQMRTGKTKAIIDNADYLYSKGKIGGVFIIAPNGVHVNWAHNEIPKHVCSPVEVGLWVSKMKAKSEKTLLSALNNPENKLAFACFNMEVIIKDHILNYYLSFCKRYEGKIMLVADESHHFGKPGSKRTKRIRGMARKADYRRILSGTAAEDSPLQLFSQFEILDKCALGHPSLNSFATEYAITANSIHQDAEALLKCTD